MWTFLLSENKYTIMKDTTDEISRNRFYALEFLIFLSCAMYNEIRVNLLFFVTKAYLKKIYCIFLLQKRNSRDRDHVTQRNNNL